MKSVDALVPCAILSHLSLATDIPPGVCFVCIPSSTTVPWYSKLLASVSISYPMDSLSALNLVSNIAQFSALAVKVGQACRTVSNIDAQHVFISEKLQILLHGLQGCVALCEKFEHEPCLSQHPEAIPALRDVKDAAYRFRKTIGVYQSHATGMRPIEASKQLENHIQWLRPGLEMLEDVLNRLWLHLHLVRTGSIEDQPYGWNCMAVDERMSSDQGLNQDGSEWVELHRVPVITVSRHSHRSTEIHY